MLTRETSDELKKDHVTNGSASVHFRAEEATLWVTPSNKFLRLFRSSANNHELPGLL